MAAMALTLPIRELACDVTIQTASTKKAVFRLEERPWLVWLAAKCIEIKMGTLIAKQRSFIKHLQDLDTAQMPSTVFEKLADDLDSIVKSGNEIIDSMQSDAVPPLCHQMWAERINLFGEQISHIDSIAEAFRLASDKECMALLAFGVEEVALR